MTLDWITTADRLQTLPPYVFARLDELKARAREQGLDLIDLGMGNPDGATPQPVVEAAVAAIQNPANHGYPPFEGTASFRRTITKWYSRRYNVELDPESEALPLLGSNISTKSRLSRIISRPDYRRCKSSQHHPQTRKRLGN